MDLGEIRRLLEDVGGPGGDFADKKCQCGEKVQKPKGERCVLERGGGKTGGDRGTSAAEGVPAERSKVQKPKAGRCWNVEEGKPGRIVGHPPWRSTSIVIMVAHGTTFGFNQSSLARIPLSRRRCRGRVLFITESFAIVQSGMQCVEISAPRGSRSAKRISAPGFCGLHDAMKMVLVLWRGWEEKHIRMQSLEQQQSLEDECMSCSSHRGSKGIARAQLLLSESEETPCERSGRTAIIPRIFSGHASTHG